MKHNLLIVIASLLLLCSGQAVAQTGQAAQQPPPSALSGLLSALQPARQTPPRVIAPDDRPTKEQLARTFELMRVDTQMRTLTENLNGSLRQEITRLSNENNANLSAEQREALNVFTRNILDRVTKLYPIEEMLGDVAGVYQRYLSRDDVEGLNAFYASPAGQHLLDAQPLMTAEYLPVVVQRVAERGNALIEEVRKFKLQNDPTRDLVGWYKTGKLSCIDISVADDDTLTAITGRNETCGIDEAHVARKYNGGEQWQKYRYVFQAWTDEGARQVRVVFGHVRRPNGMIWYPNEMITLTETPKVFELEFGCGRDVGEWERFALSFHFGGTDTFHVKLISIEPINPD